MEDKCILNRFYPHEIKSIYLSIYLSTHLPVSIYIYLSTVKSECPELGELEDSGLVKYG